MKNKYSSLSCYSTIQQFLHYSLYRWSNIQACITKWQCTLRMATSVNNFAWKMPLKTMIASCLYLGQVSYDILPVVSLDYVFVPKGSVYCSSSHFCSFTIHTQWRSQTQLASSYMFECLAIFFRDVWYSGSCLDVVQLAFIKRSFGVWTYSKHLSR